MTKNLKFQLIWIIYLNFVTILRENILTDMYYDQDMKFMKWFSTLNIIDMRNKLILKYTPENFENMNKNKRKMVKRKIRLRANKEFAQILRSKIKDFNKEDFWVHRQRPSGWKRQKQSQLKKSNY